MSKQLNLLTWISLMTLSMTLNAQTDKFFEYADSTFEMGSVHLLSLSYCDCGPDGFGICDSINSPVIIELITFMKKHPELYFQLECHADTSGSAKFNKHLSEKRASILSLELTRQYKIDSSRLKAAGLGESLPLVSDQYMLQLSSHQLTECMIEGIHVVNRRMLVRIVGIDN